MGENADANMFHSKKLPFLCVRIASIMADLPRGFNDDFSSFARGGSDGVKNTKKQHGLLTSDGQKTVLLCCLECVDKKDAGALREFLRLLFSLILKYYNSCDLSTKIDKILNLFAG